MADNAMKLIYSLTLSADSSGVTVSNIPQGYTDLYMEMSIRDTGGYLTLRPNGDSGSTNYQRTNFYGIARNAANTQSNIVASGRGTNEAGMYITAGDDAYGMNWYHLLGYSSGTVTKILFEDNAFAKPLGGAIGQWNYLWKSAAPITSLVFTASGSGTFKAGSTINIYGIKCATPGAKATGGDIVVTDGAYWYHAFTNTGAFLPNVTLTVDYLVIAGGGAGGSANTSQHGGGGGGAGGYLSSVGSSGGGASAGSPLSLAVQSYTVQVGSGGTSNANGTNSVLSTVTALGGGKGAIGATMDGAAGGSGGGGSSSSSPGAGGAASSPTQGYAGGAGQGTNNYRTGAGGGAGAVGGNGSGANGSTPESVGGAGKNTLSTWATVTNTGVSGYYAGGGGGGSGQFANPSNWPNGGAGGGGYGGFNGSTDYVASAGTANTGSGGGGSWAAGDFTNSGVGGNGGSGIVIVRYPV